MAKYSIIDNRPSGERVLATGLTWSEVSAYVPPAGVWSLVARAEDVPVDETDPAVQRERACREIREHAAWQDHVRGYAAAANAPRRLPRAQAGRWSS